MSKSGHHREAEHQATADTVRGLYAVIVAIGAEPLILPVSGVDQAKIANEVLGKEDTLGGNSVILIGGSQVGAVRPPCTWP